MPYNRGIVKLMIIHVMDAVIKSHILKIFTDMRKSRMLREKSEYKEIYTVLLFMTYHMCDKMNGRKYIKD